MMDPIADMLTRIRNASAVRKDEVVLPMSKIKFNIAKLLEANGWVGKVEEVKAGKEESFNTLKIALKYDKSGESVIRSIQRVSKPGLKVYKGKDELPRVLNNLGMAIISTSQGIMTNKEAAKKGIGGEVICEVY